MKIKSKLKRITAFILAIMMIATFIPATLFTVSAESTPQSGTDGFNASAYLIPENMMVEYIENAFQLAAIGGTNSAGKYYILANDITLTAEWVPINDFRGIFDGQGHSINNLYVLENSKRVYAGLFGYIDYAGTEIKNIGINIGTQGIAATSASGSAYAGGLIGQGLNVMVENCYVTGDVTAASTSFASELDQAFAGGLIGAAWSTRFNNQTKITNCYAQGNVFASAAKNYAFAGGLVGHRGSSTGEAALENCYAASDVSVPLVIGSYAGYLIGYGGPTNLRYCYRLSTQKVTAYISLPLYSYVNTHGTLLTTEQMKMKSSFSGWDFDDVWGFIDGVNDGYPILLAFHVIYGDVTGDGKVNIADLIRLSRHVVGNEPIENSVLLKAADVNGDGIADVSDLVRLARWIAEIDKDVPLGKTSP